MNDLSISMGSDAAAWKKVANELQDQVSENEHELESLYQKIDLLEDWSHRAAQALQDICDEAQLAAGNVDGEDQLPDLRELLLEHNQIMQGTTAQAAGNVEGQ